MSTCCTNTIIMSSDGIRNAKGGVTDSFLFLSHNWHFVDNELLNLDVTQGQRYTSIHVA